jgi:hypothetical protein
MASDATGVLDEAYQRLHEAGPEYEGSLSNHGPMAAEAMAGTATAPKWAGRWTAPSGGCRNFPAAAARPARTGAKRWAARSGPPTGLSSSCTR